MNYNDIEKAITATVGEMTVTDKGTLVNMLQKNGAMVTDTSNRNELIDTTFKAIKDNPRFRKDLENYIVSRQISTNIEENKSFVDDNYYSNLTSSNTFVNDNRYSNLTKSNTFVTDNSYSNQDGQPKQKTAAGQFLSGIFNQDTLKKAVTIGMDYYATKLQNQAAKSGNQQAIDFQNAQAQVYANQAAAAQASAIAAAAQEKAGKGKNKWIVPVAIIGGVLLIGTVLFIAVRKK